MRIEFTDAAEEDLIEAAEYYEARVRGLGHEFAAEVQRVATVLLERPTLGEKVDRMHRRVSLKRFPYALVVRFDIEVILVVAVAHRRRRARYWSFRVQDGWQAEHALQSKT